MNELMTLTFQGSNIRMVMRDGEPWWVARDVCEALEIGNPSDALKRLDEDDLDSTEVTDALGRNQTTNIVNESGLYSLILGSRKPEAKDFKRWITREVIPSIRRTGSYSLPGRYGPTTMVGQFAIPTTYSGAMRLAADLQEKVEEQQAVIQLMVPKAEFHDRVALVEDGQSIAQVAKVLGTGEIRLFRWLRECGILLTEPDHWNQPRQEYMNRGYFKLVPQTWRDREGNEHPSFKPVVTGKGLIWLQRQWDQDHGRRPLRVV